MTDLDAGQLLLQGRFSEACQAADEKFRRKPSRHHMGNKVLALLNLARFAEAREISRTITDDKVRCGVAEWLMGEHAAAIGTWRSEKSAGYTDAAGGLTCPMLLLFAGISLKDQFLQKQSLDAIAEVCASGSPGNWPGPIGSYLLGASTADELFSCLSTQPTLRGRQLCTVNFHIGAQSLHADSSKCLHHMTLSTQGPPAILLEAQYYLAKGELVSHRRATWTIS